MKKAPWVDDWNARRIVLNGKVLVEDGTNRGKVGIVETLHSWSPERGEEPTYTVRFPFGRRIRVGWQSLRPVSEEEALVGETLLA